MTKGAIHAFTRSLPATWSPHGIRVNGVAPGPVWTPLNPADKPAEKVANSARKTPMKRPAQPEEIAPAYRIPRRAAVFELHHRRDPADHGRYARRVSLGRRLNRPAARVARAECRTARP